VLYLDMKLYLENDILAKVDRASMMASLEARVPLLNVTFVDYVTALPLNLKLRGLRSKYLLRYALKGLLPKSILDRPKKGFGIPVARWIRGPLKEQVLDTLAPQKIAREGFFEAAAIETLLDDHLSGRADNRKPIWTLFAFEQWYEHHLAEREPLAPPARRVVAGR
jgi:asparagine synthase (glutamine-hydrolysing)